MSEMQFIADTLKDADKAVSVLFTMLAKFGLRDGAMVADEIGAHVKTARKQVAHLMTGTPSQLKIAAQIAHAVYHILDDHAEEHAQTGNVTVRIPASEWKELNRVLDLLGNDPHEVLHDLIGVNSPLPQDAKHE